MCMYCWYDNLFCIYGVIWLLFVKWYFRMVSPRYLSSYHSGGEDVANQFQYSCLLGLLASVTDSLWPSVISLTVNVCSETVGDR
jgi:hypothetical protein